jgi:phosphatidylserine/phosphatidylglycerophosphate/cardiolipin synthase-like enzyme
VLAAADVYEYATQPHPLVVRRRSVVRPYVDAKVVAADGVVAGVGSANLDATPSYWEREANIVVEDPGVGPLENTIESLIAHGVRIASDSDSDYWRREAGLRELAARFLARVSLRLPQRAVQRNQSEKRAAFGVQDVVVNLGDGDWAIERGQREALAVANHFWLG